MKNARQDADDERHVTVAGQRSAVIGHGWAVRPRTALIFAIVLFAAWFSAYSVAQHNAHHTYKADLGQIHLAIWNTAQGRPLQEVKQDFVSTRLTDHVEPIFVLVAPLMWLWSDARALLALQAVALALAAWPIFLLARRRLSGCGPHAARWAGWAALVCAAAFLLGPALQAAAVSDVHALSLAVPFIAWAFWAVERGRWGQFVVAALVVIGAQEGLALLGAGLGAYALARGAAAVVLGSPIRGGGMRPRRKLAHVMLSGSAAQSQLRQATSEASRSAARLFAGVVPLITLRRQPAQSDSRGIAGAWGGVIAGGAILLLGLLWFYVATFVIIPRYAAEVYDIAQTPYAARYGQLGDSFGDVLRALVTRPELVLSIAAEPLRLRTLLGLLAPTGFLALLAPEILLLSAPLLLANLLSSYGLQHAGELHYSAPLVPYFAVAGAVGLSRLLGALGALGRRYPRLGAAPVLGLSAGLVLIAVGALGWQAAAGYTPLGREFSLRGGWPQVTAHDRLLARFSAQIPPGAPGSATTDLFPHFSARELLYLFPHLGSAEWALVDVAGATDLQPTDVRAAVERMLADGWGVQDAADGYLLLRRGLAQPVIPDAFYDFARAGGTPQHALDISFGPGLKLVGYDVVDDVKWRRTALRLYWRAERPLAPEARITVQVLTPTGEVADDTALRPMPALVWYGPAQWRAGETLVTQTLPWYLPRAWAAAVTVAGGELGAGVTHVLPAWERRGGSLAQLAAPADVQPAAVQFGGGDWRVQLTGAAHPPSAAAGQMLPVTLRWRADGPAPRDYTIFLQLRNAAGRTVAGGDAAPAWFVLQPTSQWPAGTPGPVWDAHAVALPPDLAPGRYTLAAGWYFWQTGERLAAYDIAGNRSGDEFVLGQVTVGPAAGAPSDLACLMAAESCASQE